MNIVIATEFFPESETGEITGGVESRAYYVAKELAKKHNVYIITSRRKASNLFDAFSGLTVFRMGPPYPYTQSGSVLARLRFSWAASRQARKMVKANNIEVVDGYNFFTYLVPIFATFRTKARGFLTYHEVWLGSWAKNTGSRLAFLGELAERTILSLTKLVGARIVAVSEFTKWLLVKAGMKPDKILVIPNGVELSKYRQLKASKAKEPTICFIGRLTKNKRVEDLVRAVAIAKPRIRNLRCIIIGTGPEEENLKELAAEMRLGKSMEFKGFIDDHSEVIRILKSSTIFCSPSVVEGFGITLVEAIACGVPFVCSDIPPFLEISEHGLGGLHFRQGDHKALAKQLTQLLTEKDMYHKCIQQEESLAPKYDWEKLARQIEVAYLGKGQSK